MKKVFLATLLLALGAAFGAAGTLFVVRHWPHTEPAKVKRQQSGGDDSFSDPFFSQDPLREMRKMQKQMLKDFEGLDDGQSAA